MTNELKNRMDDLHQDFDKEALWSKIESKERNRKPLFWGIFALGAFAVILGILLINNTSSNYANQLNTKKKIASHDYQTSLDETCFQIFTTSDASFNEIVPTTDELDKQKNNSLSLTHPNKNYNIKTDAILPIIPPFTMNKKETKIKTSKQESINILTKKNVNNEGRSQTTNNKVEVIQSNNNYSPTLGIENTDDQFNISVNPNIKLQINQKSECTNDLATLKLIKKSEQRVIENELFLLQTLKMPSLAIPSRDLFINAILPNPISEPLPAKYNIVGIALGLGMDHHRYSNTALGEHRQNIETALETRSLAVYYERSMNLFSFTASLIASQNETVVDHSTKLNSWRLVEDGSIINGWEGYQYKLYNQYQRLDADVQMHYNIDLTDRWQFSPNLGFGINLGNSQHGNFFDREGKLQDLSKRSEYKSNTGAYITYGLRTRMYLNNDFIFDLQLFGQTERMLTKIDYQGYEQSIRPMGIRIGVGRKF